MRSLYFFSLFSVAIACFGYHFSYAQNSSSGFSSPYQTLSAGSITLQEIVVEGDSSFKQNNVRKSLPFSAGSVVDRQDIRTAFKTLFAKGTFKDIVFDLTEGEEGYILKITVEENLRLERTLFIGNVSFSSFILKKEADIDENFFIPSQVPLGEMAVREKYKKEGFLDVRVKTEVRSLSENVSQVVFFIDEGMQHVVKEINFSGNNSFSDKKIRNTMEQKKKSLLEKGFLDEAKTAQDDEKILFFYRTQGYVRAKIISKKYKTRFKDAKKRKVMYVDIDIAIDEGEQYRFGDTTIVGNKVFSTRTLTKNFRRAKGDVYNEAKHLADTTQIYTKYQENGYVFSRVTPVEEIDDERKVVNYKFEIYEGEKGHIENIFIEGLKKTKENVVRRELAVREGEIFSSDSLKRTIINLNRLDYFQLITPDFRPGSVEGLLNLSLRIKEKQTAVISGGFTYSTTGGFVLNGQLRDSNFLGRGFNFGGKLSLGLLTKSFDISFTEPWFLNKSVSLGTSFSISKDYIDYYVDTDLLDASAVKQDVEMPGGGERDPVNTGTDSIKYTSDSISLSIFSGQRFNTWYEVFQLVGVDFTRDYLAKSLLWPEKYTQYDIYQENKDLFSTSPPIDETQLSYYFQVGFSRDSLDNKLNPTTGNLLRLSSVFYFGDKQATKWSINYSTFYSPVRIPIPALNSAWTLTFAYQFSLNSFANSLFDTFIYPSRSFYTYLRPLEMRGWEYADVYDFRNQRFGKSGLIEDRPYGQAKLQHTFETRVSLPVDFLQLAFFLDVGSLSVDKISSDPKSLGFLFDFKNMMYDAGLGFRLNLPQLPIRLYWAWRFIYDKEQEKMRLFKHDRNGDGVYIPAFVLDFQAGL